MTSTCQPTNVQIQTPYGSRYEPCLPGYSKPSYYEQCGPCQPTMMTPYQTPYTPYTPYNNYYGGYPMPTMTGPWNYGPMPWNTYPQQQTPYYPSGWPQWYGPEQYNWQYQQWHQQQHGYNQTYCNIPCRPSCQTEFYCLTNPIRVLPEGNRMLWLCFDCRGFKPEECNVTFNKTERCFTIECNQECKDGKEHHVQRKYFCKYCIPETIKCDLTKCEPKCYVNQDGQLTIECQLPKMTPEEQNKCPQITYPNWYGCPPTNCYTPVNCKSC